MEMETFVAYRKFVFFFKKSHSFLGAKYVSMNKPCSYSNLHKTWKMPTTAMELMETVSIQITSTFNRSLIFLYTGDPLIWYHENM